MMIKAVTEVFDVDTGDITVVSTEGDVVTYRKDGTIKEAHCVGSMSTVVKKEPEEKS